MTCDGELSPEEHARLQEILSGDASARAFYRECLLLHGELAWSDVARRVTTARSAAPVSSPLPLDPCQAAEHPLLDSLGTSFQQILGFFSRPTVFSLLVALILPGVVLTVLLVDLALHPPERAAMAPMPAPVTPSPVNKSVARITRMNRCVWAMTGQDPSVGTTLFSNQRLELNEGLVEVVFDDGASMIIEGPSAFETRRKGGFLHQGRLVARVPKGAEGFTVETSSAVVIDYGTEFGVSVEEDNAAAEVHVFEGEVALETRSKAAKDSIERRRLTAGTAARVEVASSDGGITVRAITPVDDLFVRTLPTGAIVADFSGGTGNSLADQFPGAAGSGWTTAWGHREAESEGVRCSALVERIRPLRDGGDYLRLLAERESGTKAVRRALERHLELAGQVDLTKPHVVSFDFRVDKIAGFSERNDYLILCNNSIPEAAPRTGVASGWHIRIDGVDHKDARAKHWSFLSGGEQKREEYIGSRIPVVEGAVYSFRVLVEPEAQRWMPSISVDGGPWTKFAAMGMRSPGTAREYGYWPILAVWWKMDGKYSKDERETIGFSIDSVRISPADEVPTTR
ncbi:MAG TPA: hypothetical protein DD670_19565 [Planctomycetaceae bacterium]|nr:hypothetical protein [Planctomycetaceae bacterium]